MICDMSKFKDARSTMKRSFDSDDGLKIAYISNIAMLLHDKYDIKDFDLRNQAAEDILELIFGNYYKQS